MSFLNPNLSNPNSALIWSIVKKNQWGIIGLFLSIPVILFFELMSSNVLHSSFLNGSSKIQGMLLVAILPLLARVVIYGGLSYKTAIAGFPKATFVHPVSAFRLALVPILFGIFLSYSFIIFWFLFVAQKDCDLLQYFIIFITCNIAVVWLQFIVWRLSNAPFTTMSTFTALLTLMFVFVVSVWDIENNPPIVNPFLAQFGLAVLLISGFWFAINAVKQARANQPFGKNWRMSEIQFVGFTLPKSYFSKQQALFRFEWRVFGWMMPLIGSFISSVFIFVLIRVVSNTKILDAIALIAFGVIYISIFSPMGMSASYLGSKSRAILSFTAQLPISNFDLAHAKLNLALKSIIVFLLIILIPINLFLFSLEIGENVLQPWYWLTTNWGPVGATLVWISVNLLFPTLAWAIAGNIFSWLLKGKSLFNSRIIMYMLAETSFIIVISYLFYVSKEFTKFFSGYYLEVNIIVFLILGFMFYRAIKRFNNRYSSKEVDRYHSLKNNYFTVLALLLVFLSTLWFVGFDSQIKFHASFILLDIAILITLPFLTAPFLIKENRSR